MSMDLAGRLGVGERQLRRLFRQHLGASPIAVAQTRRILLAKQLIHETRLPMTEIAFASGFGSIRRFNETFQTLFGRPPSELRRVAGAGFSGGTGRRDCPAAALSSALRLGGDDRVSAAARHCRRRARHRAPLRAHGAARWRSREPSRSSPAAATRFAPPCAFRNSRPCRLSSRGCVGCSIWPPIRSPLPSISRRTRRSRPLVKARPGLRVPGAWDGFELAMRAVLGQQITVTAAVRLAGRLVAAYGERVATRGRALTHVFPRPERLACRRARVARHAAQPRGDALGRSAPPAAADPHLFDAHLRSRRCDQTAALDPRRRRMDRAIHRAAATARAGRLSRRRCRPYARHGRPRGARAFLIRAPRPRRRVAAVARLCRAASVGVGLNRHAPTCSREFN